MSNINYVQSVSGTGTTNLSTLTFTASSTVGDLIHVFGANNWQTTTGSQTAVSDSFGNVYTLFGTISGNAQFANSFITINTHTGTATITISSTGSPTSILWACEYTLPQYYTIQQVSGEYSVGTQVTAFETKINQGAVVGPLYFGTTTEMMQLLNFMFGVTGTATGLAVAHGTLRQSLINTHISTNVYGGYVEYDLSTNTISNTVTYTGTATALQSQVLWMVEGMYINGINYTPPAVTGSFAFVQAASAISTATATFTSSSTVGDIIIAASAGYRGTVATSVSDNLGNTYTQYGNLFRGINGTLAVFIATSAKAGTATVTFNGASTTNNDLIIAEYNVPAAGYIIEAKPDLVIPNTSSFWPYTYNMNYVLGDVNSLAMIPIVYNDYNFGTWTLSTGTVRAFTDEADGAGMMLGDVLITNPSTSTHTTTVTATAMGASGWITCPINLLGVTALSTTTSTSSGGAGLISERGWTGGFEG